MVRFKNRYITVEVNPGGQSSDKALTLLHMNLYDAVVKAVQELHGDFGVASVMGGLATKYCSEFTRVAVIRVRHGPHRFVASALPCITSVGKHQVTIHTLHTSATIRHSFLFLKEPFLGPIDLINTSVEENTICIAWKRENGSSLPPVRSHVRLLLGGKMQIRFCCTESYQRKALDKIWATLSTDKEREMMEKAILDLTSLDSLGFRQASQGAKSA